MTGSLRKLFTNEEIEHALTTDAPAKYLSDLRDVAVSTQVVSYWKKHLDTKSRGGKVPVGMAAVNREIREGMVLRTPTLNDDLAIIGTKMPPHKRLLVIPDLHAPYEHPDAIAFLTAVKAALQPDSVYCLGDETDGHALSMHDSDPNLDSAGMELYKAQQFLSRLAKLFPTMGICHSNHGSLIYRRAYKFGIPVEYIKSYRDIIFPSGGGDGWYWMEKIHIDLPNGDRLLLQHQSSGDIMANAAHERCNIIEGHEHGKFLIQYRGSTEALYWGAVSGCLIDRKSYAFAYGKNFPKKPILGCMAVIDSQPILIPMYLDTDGNWTGKLSGVFA